MTSTEFLLLDPATLPAGREADEACAFALGWEREGIHWYCPDSHGLRYFDFDTPEWSTDPHAAVDVVIAEGICVHRCIPRYLWEASIPIGDDWPSESATTYPLAVVRCVIAKRQAELREKSAADIVRVSGG